MKIITLFLLVALFFSCANEPSEQHSTVVDDETALESNESNAEVRPSRKELNGDSLEAASTQLTAYKGAWFKVEYPSNFKASPTSPVSKMDNYSFIETDEATFTSPDGTVEFFVYSPQWGGDPKTYLTQGKNERISSDKTDGAKSDDPFAVTHHWVTFEDKDGKYSRAYHSQKTESTHLVFGVKYTSIKHYERYKAAYTAFKKSLEQYAD